MILTALVRKLMLKEMSLAFVGSNERVAVKIIERVKKNRRFPFVLCDLIF